MDLVTHSLVGLAVGHAIGSPELCVLGSVVPDLAMIRRSPVPSTVYRITHSLWIPSLAVLAGAWPVAVGWMTHLGLDVVTHGETFSPRLLWPSSWTAYHSEEWEWFNRSWWTGVRWSLVVIALSLWVSGSPW